MYNSNTHYITGGVYAESSTGKENPSGVQITLSRRDFHRHRYIDRGQQNHALTLAKDKNMARLRGETYRGMGRRLRVVVFMA